MWSPETLHIGLSTQRLVFAETKKMWPGKVATCDSIFCAETADAEPWRPAVAALTRLLAAKRKANPTQTPTLRIVLSGRFVRWQLLPWHPELTQPKERVAYAKLSFRETFGNVVEDWQIQLPPQPPNQTMPACAIDSALLAALHTTCKDAGAHLVAVMPYFSSAFDRWRNTLKGKAAWFGLVEADCLSLGLLHGGSWVGLRTHRLDEDWRDVLPGMMAQIGIPNSLEDTTPSVYLAGDGEPPASSTGAVPFTWLQPAAQAKPGKVGCRMALGI
ncbi:MAG: hypothetical protein Q7T00_06590 [Rugosibacter sp.]|nr:hypothetical protein [Rugosibacter sp.]